MPKLYRNKGQYSFSSHYKQDGDIEYKVVKATDQETEQYDESPEIRHVETEYLSPTKWLSKNLLETSQNDHDSDGKSTHSRNMQSGKTADEDSDMLESVPNSKIQSTAAAKTKASTRISSTDNLSKDLLKRCFANKFKNYQKQVTQGRINKSTKRAKGKTVEKTNKSNVHQNPFLESEERTSDLTSKRYSLGKYSPLKSAKALKHSVSKRELSAGYSKNLLKTAKNARNARRDIHSSKIDARESINNLNSPERSVSGFSGKKLGNILASEVADETPANFGKSFMDEYYASNGYFSFSMNSKEMREKDGVYDKLKTFVDERLLEVASQISVKQRKEEEKTDNIDKLTNLKLHIDNLVDENQNIMAAKAQEEDRNRKFTEQTDFLLQQVRNIREKHAKIKAAWKTESKRLYKNLQTGTDSYNHAEKEYQEGLQEIRVEMHDDMSLIKELETSVGEADVIHASLFDKVKFSRKLEKERQKMIQDRALLLGDLCTKEKLKYRKKLNTLPSFIEVPHSKKGHVDNISSKIRHKLFTSNGKIRKRSPDLYTRKEAHIQQQMRLKSEKKNRLNSTSRKSIVRANNISSEAFLRPNKF